MICAGDCGRELVQKRTWACMTEAERAEARQDNVAAKYSHDRCKACSGKPAEPRGDQRRQLRNDTVEAWEAAGCPARNTPEYNTLAVKTLGIRVESLTRNLRRHELL